MRSDSPTRSALDPAIESFLNKYPMALDPGLGVESLRRQMRSTIARKKLLPEVRSEDRFFEHVEARVPVRIYWPPNHGGGQLPVTVFFHGGGFVFGDLDTHDNIARAHSVAADAIVVAIDYRLAPEHPFPAAVVDAWEALCWVSENAAGFGGNPESIAVAGDSAGGNLVATTALMARDNGGPSLRFQLLWYPWLSADVKTSSMTENAAAPGLSMELVEAFMSWYVKDLDVTDPSSLSPLIAPVNATDVAGLPPAFIGTAGHDPLRDGGFQYAARLEAAGVAVELHNESTLIHGYVGMSPVSPAAASATARGLAALRYELHSRTTLRDTAG